jgi:ATP-binding protein involved in chromosome partitioning
VSVTQQQVQDALAKVASPRGVALTNANVLSAITVADGKVFFSINVDAAEARAWERRRGGSPAASARAGGAARLVA